MSALLSVLLGIVVVLVVTAATGYFVAQEFAYLAVDRSRIGARAAAGDTVARRVQWITSRTSFLLSGAQLGITVTGLLAGYVAEPMIGAGLADLVGVGSMPPGVGVAVGAAVALVLVTIVQMVFGELVAKNLAIARPEPVARRLALSTRVYLKVLGPVIRVFDGAAAALVRAVGIAPVQDVQHAASPRDLERIVADSRAAGVLTTELSVLLDRSLDFADATAEHAMVPRPRVAAVAADELVAAALDTMTARHSRLLVYGGRIDDVVGVVDLRDLLAVPSADRQAPVRRFSREVPLVPAALKLPQVVAQLRVAGAEFACVMDEYGGVAGVLTVEDVAEELVGEIADEYDADPAGEPTRVGPSRWRVPGDHGVDEVERLVRAELPHGPYESVGGLVVDRLGRLPTVGDEVTVPVGDAEAVVRSVRFEVVAVERRVPTLVAVSVQDLAQAGDEAGDG